MTHSQERRPAGANHEAPKSSNGQADDSSDSTTAEDVLALIRQRAARDPRKGLRREQRQSARRQRRFRTSIEPEPDRPQSFGLTADELRKHASDLRLQGWSDEEIRARLIDPRQVAA